MTVTVGKVKVGVAVMVGVSVIVGVKVIAGVKVFSGVEVNSRVGVDVGRVGVAVDPTEANLQARIANMQTK